MTGTPNCGCGRIDVHAHFLPDFYCEALAKADADGFRAEAELALRLGFSGKTCIHPSQVAAANAVFQPSAADLASARKVVEAAAQADAQGNVIEQGERKLVDTAFLMGSSTFGNSDQLRYEKRLLDDWLRRELKPGQELTAR